MGQAQRTTRLLLDFSDKEKGGANRSKKAALAATSEVLNQARSFYLDFFLAHSEKLFERVQLVNQETGEVREATISSDKLLTWAEYQTVSTREHPDPSPRFNFSAQFPEFPWEYRRSVIKDCIGKARAYHTAHATWKRSGKKKGKPGLPTPANHPTLYAGIFSLQLDQVDLRESFVKLRLYSGTGWEWVNYPVKENRYVETRLAASEWRTLAPKLVVKQKRAEIHFPQEKTVRAKKIVESKRDPDLVTVAVDLNVKQLAVITVRQHGKIIETVFRSDQGLDAHRYRHLKKIAKKQWQAGKAVKGERSNQPIWSHVKRMEPASSAVGVVPEEKGFLALGKAAPFIGVASCSAAPPVAMKRRPISMRASMCITPSGKKGIGTLARSPLRRRLRGEQRRPVRLEVGWEKDGEGNPADPSQARLQTSRHAK